jgi:hypothetical protein
VLKIVVANAASRNTVSFFPCMTIHERVDACIRYCCDREGRLDKGSRCASSTKLPQACRYGCSSRQLPSACLCLRSTDAAFCKASCVPTLTAHISRGTASPETRHQTLGNIAIDTPCACPRGHHMECAAKDSAYACTAPRIDRQKLRRSREPAP